jgi:enediyne biosynthesis protein E7
VSRARTLGPVETVRALAALTRPDRVDHLSMLAGTGGPGVVLRTPVRSMLITSDPAVVKHVLVERTAGYVKGLGQAHARDLIGAGLLTAEGTEWQRHRAAVTPHLRARAVHPHVQPIVELATANIERLAADHWSQRDLAPVLAEYTLGCLGRVFNFTAPSAARVHRAFEVVQDEAIFQSVTQRAVPLWLRPKTKARVAQALLELQAEAAASTAASDHTQEWTSTEGMLSLFLAGYETTASTLAWAVHYLAGRPQLQEKLAAEGLALLGSAPVTIHDIGRLEWSTAVFKETIRLRPPVWLISRQAISQDIVAGTRLHPGDEVLILPGARHTVAQGEFDPTRFLGAARTGESLAFGAGPRACPGGALADLEATAWLAIAAARLEFRPVVGVPVRVRARMSQAPARTRVQIRRRQEIAEISRKAEGVPV